MVEERKELESSMKEAVVSWQEMEGKEKLVRHVRVEVHERKWEAAV